MKKILILCSLIVLLLVGCQSQTTEETKKTLVVGMELAYPPFETKDEAGNPVGVSIDIAKAFADYLGYDIEIQNTNWTGLIPALETDQVDMVISSMTITEARKESVDFSDGYAQAYLAFLVNVNSNVSVAADLNAADKTIVVKTGSTGDTYVSAHYPLATILRLDDESAAVAEVVNGNADAFIYDQLTIVRNVEANADSIKAVFIPDQTAEEWGAAFKKGSDLTAQFNTFLAEFKANGGFSDLIETHLKEEKAAFDAAGFTFFFE